MASYLAGKQVQPGEDTDLRNEFSDIAVRLRVTGPGQAIELQTPNDANNIWLAGNGRGVVRSVLVHFDGKGCTLSSTRKASLQLRLREVSGNGEAFARVFVEEMRELAKRQDTCGCGTPLRFELAKVAG